MGDDKDCLICRKQRGESPPPGGTLYQDEFVHASHAHFAEGQATQYLGWLVVETRRHIPGLDELTDGESKALGLMIARLSRALKATSEAEHIYAFVLGHGVPHLHVHLLPRYPGTPREYWGVRVDEWPAAPRGGQEQIQSLCDRLRARLKFAGE